MRILIALCTLAAAALSVHALTTNNGPAPERDGQHDFDFEVGHWHIHLKRRLHPLTGSNQWVEFDGTSATRFLWHGAAQIEQFETDGAGGHIEGLTLRTYNPASHQWRLYWASASNGIVLVPQIGQFANGQGEFYAQDTLNGKSIFIRFIWSKTNTDTPHFEQAFSADGGKTWEVNWITDQNRVADTTEQPIAHASEPQHDFDFIFGQWKYHLKRKPSGSNTWVEYDGNLTGHRIWDGRANLGETDAEGPDGHVMGLTLRTYNPKTKQWYLYWANSRDGIVSDPQIGEFTNGVGEFYAQDSWENRGVLVKYTWSRTTTSSPHFEQGLSSDGGRTWDVNWITDQTRVGQ